ncbi:MAG: DUF1467 family protein [Alphaproteobacteria bacterium]
MDWFTGAIVFILIWWTAIFCVLPWGLKRDAQGLPTNLDFTKKLLYTTAVTSMIWVIVYGFVEMDIVSFHEMAFKMTKEDHLS